jgi:hypothetical protein
MSDFKQTVQAANSRGYNVVRAANGGWILFDSPAQDNSRHILGAFTTSVELLSHLAQAHQSLDAAIGAKAVADTDAAVADLVAPKGCYLVVANRESISRPERVPGEEIGRQTHVNREHAIAAASEYRAKGWFSAVHDDTGAGVSP